MGEITKADLLPQLAEQFECTERTIETRLKELTEGDEPFLVRSKVGKEVRYSILNV